MICRSYSTKNAFSWLICWRMTNISSSLSALTNLLNWAYWVWISIAIPRRFILHLSAFCHSYASNESVGDNVKQKSVIRDATNMWLVQSVFMSQIVGILTITKTYRIGISATCLAMVLLAFLLPIFAVIASVVFVCSRIWRNVDWVWRELILATASNHCAWLYFFFSKQSA